MVVELMLVVQMSRVYGVVHVKLTCVFEEFDELRVWLVIARADQARMIVVIRVVIRVVTLLMMIVLLLMLVVLMTGAD